MRKSSNKINLFIFIKFHKTNEFYHFSFLAVDVANVGGGNIATLEAHSNQTSKQTLSMNQNSQSINNHNLGLNKTNNHQISMNHNHTNINTSLGHKSPSFLMKSSLLPFLNR